MEAPNPDPAALRTLVLVVDDDAAVRHALAEALRHAGFIVCTASSADEAVVLLDSTLPIDALITDVEMPGAHDGLDLVAMARRTHPQMLIAVASGLDVSKKLPKGVPFFRKPYSSASVIDFLKDSGRFT